MIFIDEVDSLLPRRSETHCAEYNSIASTLLTEMDGVCSATDGRRVAVIGATNRIDAVDPAFRRGGRFGAEISFPPPDAEVCSFHGSVLT